MSLSENPHETKPLDEEATARLQLLANGLTHQYGGPDGKGGTDVLSADVRAALTALAKAQRENTRLADLGARSYVKYSDAANALAAAQLNARALREALVRIHQAHYDAAYSHDAQKLAVYDCMAKWAHEAYASAPADEAALREWGIALVRETIRRNVVCRDEHRNQLSAEFIVNAALGAPETHAKEG